MECRPSCVEANDLVNMGGELARVPTVDGGGFGDDLARRWLMRLER
jgi:hypothetical protein